MMKGKRKISVKVRGWTTGLIAAVLIIGFGYACQDPAVDPLEGGQEQSLKLQLMEGSAHAPQLNFRTHLSGDNEVPAVETDAQGQATFKVSSDGTSIDYKLIVANIENVLMAHIHNAPAGENGGVVVWLYPEDGPPPQLIPGQTQGVLAEGTITADDLTGSLEGATLNDLLEEIRTGNAYVNVHTEQNPAGEVRGQIE